MAFLVTIALGLAFGTFVGHAAFRIAGAQTGCPIEQGSFTNGPDSIQDTDDGVDWANTSGGAYILEKTSNSENYVKQAGTDLC